MHIANKIGVKSYSGIYVLYAEVSSRTCTEFLIYLKTAG
jgi:hypothetical protein